MRQLTAVRCGQVAPEYLQTLPTFLELKEYTQNRSKEVRTTMPPLHPS
jgi:hypothetical protein